VTETIGPHTITRELGRGGMGVVYLGRDTRLDRDVAIKALPVELASDPVRLERFEREARTLAQLNHPNLAGIHGVEEQDGARYLVLEYVEGETLADRLDRGPIPVDEAIELAVQIASGVEAAHEAGVIHRDLKPGNIIVTPEGQAKVLDFGLARVEEASSSSSGGISESPTLTSPAVQHSPTMPGVILGTAAYMSPEQARGRKVDKRTDIWSFGVVLYEMLTGASPFLGETVTDSIGAILHKEPDWSLLPPATPGNVRRVLRRCVERDKTKRYRDIGDVAVELRDVDDDAGVVATPPRRRSWLAGVAALLVVAAITLAGAALLIRPAPAPAARMTFPVTLIPGGELATGAGPNLAISPDGARLVIAAAVDGERGLWVRDLASDTATLLPDTAGAASPAFSPDGQWIAYFTDAALWKIATAGGSPQRLSDAESSHRGVAWLGLDRLVYAPDTTSPIHMISAAGGTPETITTLDSSDGARPHRSHRWPAPTPDGASVVFTAQNSGESFNDTSIMVVELASGRTTTLLEGAGSYPIVLPGGELLYTTGNTVYACRVDWSAPTVVGSPRPLLYEVLHRPLNGGSHLAVAGDGTALFIRGASQEDIQGVPTWLDLASGERTPLLDSPTTAIAPRISPDGARVTWQTGDVSLAGSLVIYEIERGVRTEITLPRTGRNPVWSPDGRELAFTMSTEGSAEVPHIVNIDGESPPRPLVAGATFEQFTNDWSRDGSRILTTQWSSEADWQLYSLQRDGDSWASSPVLATPAAEMDGRFSPDGEWIAYLSDISGRIEIFIRRIEGPPDRRQVSVAGGFFPLWAPDGRSVYYFELKDQASNLNGRLMQVELTEVDGRLEPSAPRALHELQYASVRGPWSLHDLHPDGTRLLYIAPPAGDAQRATGANQAYLKTGLIDEIRRAFEGSP